MTEPTEWVMVPRIKMHRLLSRSGKSDAQIQIDILKANDLLSAAPAPPLSPNMEEQSAQAVIENGMIVIRIPLDNLPMILEGGWLCNAYDTRWKITDGVVAAKEIVHALNHEDEEGSTPIHKLFDAAINEALEQGAQGIEEHEEQER